MTRAFLILAAAATLAGCYRANPDTGVCLVPTDDRVFVQSADPGVWCFDDGDGYPTIYPPITTAPPYPTTGT